MKLSEVLAARERAKNKIIEGASPVGSKPVQKSNGGNSVINVVRTKETPNPDALQFVVNAEILGHGKKSYSSARDCDGDQMAEAIFDMGGIKNVYVMQNFITVTKTDAHEWDLLKDRVWKAIDRTVSIYSAEKTAKIEIDVENFPALSDADKLQAVEMVLDRSIRANLARDGGGVELKGISGDEVSIQYQGACESCSTSSTGTLKYIQEQLKQQLHPSLKVKPV
jgi:Fe-S cluster biogenesis protein NfuA